MKTIKGGVADQLGIKYSLNPDTAALGFSETSSLTGLSSVIDDRFFPPKADVAKKGGSSRIPKSKVKDLID